MSTSPDVTLFAVACPGCRATVGVGSDLIEQIACCPLCGGAFRVPDPGPLPASEPATPPSETVATDRSVMLPPDSVADGAAAPAPLRLQPPTHRIAGPDGEIELRRLSPEEKARRRVRRNLVLVIAGVTILLVLAAILAR